MKNLITIFPPLTHEGVAYYKKAKQNFKYLFFTLQNFTLTNFETQIKGFLNPNKTYSIYIKLSFSSGTDYKMAGSQIGFQIKDILEIGDIAYLYNRIYERIYTAMDEYYYVGEVDGIQISISDINLLPQLKLQSINSTIKNNIPNRITNKKEISKNFSNQILPLTVNEAYFGSKLEGEDKLNAINLIKSKNPSIENSNYNKTFYSDYINSNDKIFEYKAQRPSFQARSEQAQSEGIFKIYYIVITRPEQGGNNDYTPMADIFKSSAEGEDYNFKHVFDASYGFHVLSALDNNIKWLSGTCSFERTIGNTTLLIEGDKIINSNIKVNFKPISSKIINKGLVERNIKFGTFDLETFVDTDQNAKVYAAGFKTYEALASKDVSTWINQEGITRNDKNLFYLTDYKNSKELILDCIDSMLVPKYHNYTFYCHNFGNYDLYFIFSILEEFNMNKREAPLLQSEGVGIDIKPKSTPSTITEIEDYYNFTMFFRDDQVLKLELKIRDSNNKVIKINFVDSLNILGASLDKLAKDFKVQTKKGYFPYDFVNANNLTYVGSVPNIKYFNNISKLVYDTLLKSKKQALAKARSGWSFKDETLIYLNKDLRSLLEVINECSKILFAHFNMNITGPEG
jgi:DNA polymerase type B, organellar and viral